MLSLAAPKFHTDPDRRQKRAIVGEMQKQAWPGRNPEQFVTGVQPHQVQFPNQKSAHDKVDLMSAEVAKCLHSRANAKWPTSKGRPTVINGLRVVAGEGGKWNRFCMNPFLPSGELGPGPASRMCISFTPAEVACMAANDLSSAE